MPTAKPAKPAKPARPAKPANPAKPVRAVVVMILIAAALTLSGCAFNLNRTPILSESDGESVVAYATGLKIGLGNKDATSIGKYELSADGGLKMDAYGQQTDQTAALTRAIELGAQLGNAYLGKQGAAAGGAAQDNKNVADTDDATDTDQDEADAALAYSSEGYGGSPGADGSGVYGRPNCARCRAYKAAHPDVAIINTEEGTNRAALWAALRKRGFVGGSAALPVLITADGYTLSAK